jgi:hypothetical protein
MFIQIGHAANPMVAEAALPYGPMGTQLSPKSIRRPTFDVLDNPLQRLAGSWCKKQVEMVGHQNKGVELKCSLVAVVQ